MSVGTYHRSSASLVHTGPGSSADNSPLCACSTALVQAQGTGVYDGGDGDAGDAGAVKKLNRLLISQWRTGRKARKKRNPQNTNYLDLTALTL